MLNFIREWNTWVGGWIWGAPAMLCIMFVGIWLSLFARFIQFRKFGYTLKHTFGAMFDKKEAGDGALTSFQSVCTAALLL